ncbi:MAG: hypothetical protein CM1200mP26_10160 [Acidimicrobiales bacterium]|nr:MAG: hypothetical protein CM1200mP26_10160 [Acidimicrobiales bacterium]
MSTPDSPVSSDQVLDDLVDATPTGAARLDGQGRAVRVNARWEATTGRPASQALGDGWTADVDPDGRAEFLADLTSSLATARRSEVDSDFWLTMEQPAGSTCPLVPSEIPLVAEPLEMPAPS